MSSRHLVAQKRMAMELMKVTKEKKKKKEKEKKKQKRRKNVLPSPHCVPFLLRSAVVEFGWIPRKRQSWLLPRRVLPFAISLKRESSAVVARVIVR